MGEDAPNGFALSLILLVFLRVCDQNVKNAFPDSLTVPRCSGSFSSKALWKNPSLKDGAGAFLEGGECSWARVPGAASLPYCQSFFWEDFQ
jgi:hypothetical protein